MPKLFHVVGVTLVCLVVLVIGPYVVYMSLGTIPNRLSSLLLIAMMPLYMAAILVPLLLNLISRTFGKPTDIT